MMISIITLNKPFFTVLQQLLVHYFLAFINIHQIAERLERLVTINPQNTEFELAEPPKVAQNGLDLDLRRRLEVWSVRQLLLSTNHGRNFFFKRWICLLDRLGFHNSPVFGLQALRRV